MAAPDPQIRASDAEREQVIDDLRRHAADGRLTMEEFEERVGEALAAKTHADLEPVLRELPPLDHEPSPVNREPRALPRARRRMPVPSMRAVVSAVLVVVAVALVFQGWWWVIFPLMGVLGGCGRSGSCATSRRAHHRGWHTDLHHRGRHTDVHHRGRHTDVIDERELVRL